MAGWPLIGLGGSCGKPGFALPSRLTWTDANTLALAAIARDFDCFVEYGISPHLKWLDGEQNVQDSTTFATVYLRPGYERAQDCWSPCGTGWLQPLSNPSLLCGSSLLELGPLGWGPPCSVPNFRAFHSGALISCCRPRVRWSRPGTDTGKNDNHECAAAASPDSFADKSFKKPEPLYQALYSRFRFFYPCPPNARTTVAVCVTRRWATVPSGLSRPPGS